MLTPLNNHCQVANDVETMREKIELSFKDIEKRLNISINYNLTVNDNNIILKGKHGYNYIYTIFKTFKSFRDNIDTTKPLIFECSPFALSPVNTKQSILSFYIDNEFNILSLEIQASSIHISGFNINGFHRVSLKFDNSFCLNRLSYTSSDPVTKIIHKVTKEKQLLSSLKDEILLYKIYQNKDEDMIDLLPEFYIPSAYGFNSAELLARLEVFSMYTN